MSEKSVCTPCGFGRHDLCHAKHGLSRCECACPAQPTTAAPAERTAPAQPVKVPFTRGLTVIMSLDTGPQQADRDLAAIKDGGTVIRTSIDSESYFHQLRLRVAENPKLAESIVVFYFNDNGKPQEIGLQAQDSLKWPPGFLMACWDIETEITKINHPQVREAIEKQERKQREAEGAREPAPATSPAAPQFMPDLGHCKHCGKSDSLHASDGSCVPQGDEPPLDMVSGEVARLLAKERDDLRRQLAAVEAEAQQRDRLFARLCEESGADWAGNEILTIRTLRSSLARCRETLRQVDGRIEAAWVAGAKVGWNCAVADNPEAFRKAIEAHSQHEVAALSDQPPVTKEG